jgi:hypothetical protein
MQYINKKDRHVEDEWVNRYTNEYIHETEPSILA